MFFLSIYLFLSRLFNGLEGRELIKGMWSTVD